MPSYSETEDCINLLKTININHSLFSLHNKLVIKSCREAAKDRRTHNTPRKIERREKLKLKFQIYVEHA